MRAGFSASGQGPPRIASSHGCGVAVLALVGEEQLGGAAELRRAVDAGRIALHLHLRHRFEEGLVGVLAPLLERDPPDVAAVVEVLVAGVVVLDLVVVPDHHEGMGRVHVLERLVALVQAVLLAVLVERLHVAVAVDAGGVAARAAVGALLVDVVAEAEDEVEVLLLRQPGLGVVEAGVPVLAGEVPDPDRLLRVRRRGRAELAHATLLALGEEAVEVLLAGLQPLDPVVDGVVAVLLGLHRDRLEHLVEALVGRHLDRQLRAAVDPREPGPDRDRLRRGEAGGNPVRELAALGERQPLPPGDRRVVERRRQREARGRAADQELAPAQSLPPDAAVSDRGQAAPAYSTSPVPCQGPVKTQDTAFHSR